MGSHALLAKLMYGRGWPRGTPHSLAEIQQAAQWMYYGGDLTEVLLAAALFASWPALQRKSGASAAPSTVQTSAC